MASAIRLPSSPSRGVNIECNAPLSTFNARVEKEVIEYDLDKDDTIQRSYVPRAHESAIEQSERAIRRRREEANKLNMFLVQTKARIISGSKEVQEAEAVLDDKTRRRLDQSWNLIPRPSTAPAMRKRSSRSTKSPGGGGHDHTKALLPASSIAIQLGYAVHAELTESFKARESLLAHRKLLHEEDTPDLPEADPAEKPNHASPHAEVARAVTVLEPGRINSSVCSQGRPAEGLFEGERRERLREESQRVQVYKEIRSAMMQGERARVREFRKHQTEQLARERAAAAEGKAREEEEREREEEARIAEEHRLQGIQHAMAAHLEAERELSERVQEPRRQQVRRGRFREALRCRLLDTSTTPKAKAIPLCPCNPPRTVQDGRVWLCANNCALNGNDKLYHRLVRDLHPHL